MNTPRNIPVTILTGFLGSGKTTLLNRILREEHGKRIAVIENEFGEVGIDQALVINADEEIFEMSNGCICCTVRGDLIRVLGNLMKRRDKFDYVLVETTGLADPGPVAQTFFMDDEIRAEFALDGIVTLVDAAHIEQQLGRSDESTEQVAFADVLVLNKTDLVDDDALDRLEARLRDMNRMARVIRSERADVAVETVLNLGAFDLEQVLGRRPTFLEPESTRSNGPASIRSMSAATSSASPRDLIRRCPWSSCPTRARMTPPFVRVRSGACVGTPNLPIPFVRGTRSPSEST